MLYMESCLEGISCVRKSFTKSGQNLSVALSDRVNDAGSILASIVQTKLVESQFNTSILKSEHTMNVTAVFGKTDCDGIILTHPMPDLSVDLNRNLYLKGNRNIVGDSTGVSQSISCSEFEGEHARLVCGSLCNVVFGFGLLAAPICFVTPFLFKC